MKPMLAASNPRAQGVMVVALAACAVFITGCGERRVAAPAEVAAKVNKDEIAVSQITAVLQQQRGLKPEHADAAGRQVLERLIDQQLALQKADELKLDRDPRVVQQLEAARREILARAYFDKVGEAAPKPTAEEIKKYYDDKPALFSERRVYNIQEIAIEARPDQLPELRAKLSEVKNIGEFVEHLKASDIRFAGNQAVRAAEQLPMQSLDALSRMKDGQAIIVPAASGVQVIVLAGSRSQPVTEEQARPAIENYLLNERKRRLVEDDLKAMRSSAKVEYTEKFAPKPAAPASASAPASK